MTEHERKERILDIVTELLVEHPELTDEQLELFIATANLQSSGR